MKIYITGINGQLGNDIRIQALQHGHEVKGCGRQKHEMDYYQQIDISDYEQCKKILEEKPDIIIHCAAWTDVDGAENVQVQNTVYKCNVEATRNITKISQQLNIKLVYISSDYVYGGFGQELNTEETKPMPLNFYGQTKYQGELEALKYTNTFILRISWLFGPYGRNFVSTILGLSMTYPKLTVITDQIGRPTYTTDLSKLILEMIKTDKYGIYNVSNEGPFISWYDYTKYILKDKNIEICGVTSEEYYKDTIGANRPLNSRLDTSKLIKNGFTPLPSWTDAVDRYKQGL